MSPSTFNVLKELFHDFPSSDPLVRHVLLLQVFVCEIAATPVLPTAAPTNSELLGAWQTFVDKCQQKIESISLAPVKRLDLLEVLSSKFAPEKFQGILIYGQLNLGMSSKAVDELVREVAFRCLEVGCKGKMLKKIVELHPPVEDALRRRVMEKYRLTVDDLPPWEDEDSCMLYEAPLCQDFLVPRATMIERIQELTNARMIVSSSGSTVVQEQVAMQVDAQEDASRVEDVEEGTTQSGQVMDTASDDEDEDDLVCGQRYVHVRMLTFFSLLGSCWSGFTFDDDTEG